MNSLTIKKSVYIDATPEEVFDALTSSNDIVRYFPLKKVTSEWQVGGEILLDGEVDGNAFRDYGLIQALSRPHHFKYSYWSDNHGTERTPENHLTVEYRLSAKQQGTQLDLEQANLRSEAMFRVMDTVWDHLLGSLAKYLESRA
ncbi:SRPBCC domain-containing protein [Methylomonas sp. SURF-1]|uniref:SRPBCC domain-containing protein n=1 Tax=Methylomonas aurea TaxID=2952224 RepID=A0ABT1ULP7_9GAMM|nr:SRPBCC domain-containing protein [Methylomonas sp. SURF-1]MCQ8183158.1 SRPBCC domain-containing protein [Methylomonas sp. SURF-1]